MICAKGGDLVILKILEKTKIYNDDDNNDDRQRTNFDLSSKTSIVYKQAI